jgi:Na+/proline symporter
MACSCCLRGWLSFSVTICTEIYTFATPFIPNRSRWHGVLMLFAWLAAFLVSICTEHFIVDICAYPRRIRWHGVLMLFAWVLFLPVGAMMPRHRCVHVSVCVCMCVCVHVCVGAPFR